MMTDTTSTIRIDINSAQALQGLRDLQTGISNFNRSVVSSNQVAVEAQDALNRQLRNSIDATGRFSTSIANVESSVSRFGKSLDSGKMKLGDYFAYGMAASNKFGSVFSRQHAEITELAEERVKRLQTQYIALGKTTNGMTKALAIKPLQLHNQQLAISVQRHQIMNKLLSDGSTALVNFGKNTQWAGRQLMVGFSVPLSIFAVTAGQAFKEIEEATISFKRVYGDAMTTVSQTEAATQGVKDLALEYTKYGIAVKDTIGLAAKAAATGLQGAELTEATAQATRLATLGQIDQNQALEATISLQSAFGISSQDLAKNIDFLNAVENQTITSLDDITTAIPKVAPVIKGLGGDVQDLAVMLTAMREGGVSAAEGANALKSGLSSLISPTNKAKKTVAEFGINLDSIANQNKGDLMGMVNDFAMALGQLDDFSKQQVLTELFGKFQYARMGALFSNITKDSSQAQRVVELTGKSIQELSSLSQKELGMIEQSISTKFTASIDKLKAAIAPIGETFMTMAIPFIDGVTKILNSFNELSPSVKTFVSAVVIGFGVVVPTITMAIGLFANFAGQVMKFGLLLRSVWSGFRSGGKDLGYWSNSVLDATAAAASLEGKIVGVTSRLDVQRVAVDQLTAAYRRMTTAAGVAVVSPSIAGIKKPIKRQRGGTVPGSGTGDIIPALLEPKETVMTKEASEKYGPVLAAMNAGKLRGFAGGGMADGGRARAELGHMEGFDPRGLANTLLKISQSNGDFANKLKDLTFNFHKLVAVGDASDKKYTRETTQETLSSMLGKIQEDSLLATNRYLGTVTPTTGGRNALSHVVDISEPMQAKELFAMESSIIEKRKSQDQAFANFETKFKNESDLILQEAKDLRQKMQSSANAELEYAQSKVAAVIEFETARDLSIASGDKERIASARIIKAKNSMANAYAGGGMEAAVIEGQSAALYTSLSGRQAKDIDIIAGNRSMNKAVRDSAMGRVRVFKGQADSNWRLAKSNATDVSNISGAGIKRLSQSQLYSDFKLFGNKIGKNVVAGTADGAEVNSPSKATIRIMDEIANGFVVGGKKSKGKVSAAGALLGKDVIDGIQDKVNSRTATREEYAAMDRAKRAETRVRSTMASAGMSDVNTERILRKQAAAQEKRILVASGPTKQQRTEEANSRLAIKRAAEVEAKARQKSSKSIELESRGRFNAMDKMNAAVGAIGAMSMALSMIPGPMQEFSSKLMMASLAVESFSAIMYAFKAIVPAKAGTVAAAGASGGLLGKAGGAIRALLAIPQVKIAAIAIGVLGAAVGATVIAYNKHKEALDKISKSAILTADNLTELANRLGYTQVESGFDKASKQAETAVGGTAEERGEARNFVQEAAADENDATGIRKLLSDLEQAKGNGEEYIGSLMTRMLTQFISSGMPVETAKQVIAQIADQAGQAQIGIKVVADVELLYDENGAVKDVGAYVNASIGKGFESSKYLAEVLDEAQKKADDLSQQLMYLDPKDKTGKQIVADFKEAKNAVDEIKKSIEASDQTTSETFGQAIRQLSSDLSSGKLSVEDYSVAISLLQSRLAASTDDGGLKANLDLLKQENAGWEKTINLVTNVDDAMNLTAISAAGISIAPLLDQLQLAGEMTPALANTFATLAALAPQKVALDQMMAEQQKLKDEDDARKASLADAEAAQEEYDKFQAEIDRLEINNLEIDKTLPGILKQQLQDRIGTLNIAGISIDGVASAKMAVDLIGESIEDLQNGPLRAAQDRVKAIQDSMSELQDEQAQINHQIDLYNQSIAEINERYKEQLDPLNKIRDEHQAILDTLKYELEVQTRTLEVQLTELNNQKTILERTTNLRLEAIEKEKEAFEESSKAKKDALQNQLDSIEKQIEALDKVAEVNEIIARQQQNQLGLAQALTSGDMGAAAAAMQESQQQSSADALTLQKTGFQSQVDLINGQLSDLDTGDEDFNKSYEERRRAIELPLKSLNEQIEALEYSKQLITDTYDLRILGEQTIISDQSRNIELIERRRDIEIEFYQRKIDEFAPQLRQINNEIWEHEQRIKDIQDNEIRQIEDKIDALGRQKEAMEDVIDDSERIVAQQKLQNDEAIEQLKLQQSIDEKLSSQEDRTANLVSLQKENPDFSEETYNHTVNAVAAMDKMIAAIPQIVEASRTGNVSMIEDANLMFAELNKAFEAVGITTKLEPLDVPTAPATSKPYSYGGDIAILRARGGMLPGYTPVANGDDMLVGMRSGEGVIVSEALRGNQYEVNRLNALNKAALGGNLANFYNGKGFAEGGIMPVEGPITSPYGGRYNPISSAWENHDGIDIGAPSGSPVRSMLDGSVTYAGWNNGYGNQVSVNHGNGLSSFYAHMSAIVVALGDLVKKGQQVGNVGSTGYSTGPHLHFGASMNGASIDPMSVITGAAIGGGDFISSVAAMIPEIKMPEQKGWFSGAVAMMIEKVVNDGLKTSSLFASTDPGGSGVERWRSTVLQALSIVGQPSSLADLTLRLINKESGGNPTIVNDWDINAQNGTPSVGLAQVIGPTYQQYKHPDYDVGPYLYNSSTNPLANLLASMRYGLAVYGSLESAYTQAGGYAKGGILGPLLRDNGGILPQGRSLIDNKTGKPEWILRDDQISNIINNVAGSVSGIPGHLGAVSGDVIIQDSGNVYNDIQISVVARSGDNTEDIANKVINKLTKLQNSNVRGIGGFNRVSSRSH